MRGGSRSAERKKSEVEEEPEVSIVTEFADLLLSEEESREYPDTLAACVGGEMTDPHETSFGDGSRVVDDNWQRAHRRQFSTLL